MCGERRKKKKKNREKPRVNESIFDFPFVCADIDEKEIYFDGKERFEIEI